MLALDGPYVIGPVVALMVTGLLALLLHRALRRQEAAAAARPSISSRPDDYGLLVPVASCRDRVDADLVREHLATAGIRSTLTTGVDGRIRVLVFADALDRARRLVG
ncbi:MAG: hypothetical protein HOV71_02270 [Hamadaea sp.]|uniref:hypothetical protein n=1 Tax=Hamadaea sp. NPDC050747 TaxID=3155789 RepID=UPI0017DAE0E5|nr:hypothetical protein [Hamadaea sp.]NUR46939.1 hypothetical protein [Hamadaea sp.]NUT07758.1 hypothetical protein [Hamadaea sp.]